MFLPGEDEIKECKEYLIERSGQCRMKSGQLWIVILYGIINDLIKYRHSNLPYEEQRKVFQQTPRGYRKVILASGIAETGISIDGITTVIDCGFESIQVYKLYYTNDCRFDKHVSINTLLIQPISKVD